MPLLSCMHHACADCPSSRINACQIAGQTESHEEQGLERGSHRCSSIPDEEDQLLEGLTEGLLHEDDVRKARVLTPFMSLRKSPRLFSENLATLGISLARPRAKTR